jgi:hypothetical protein
VDAARAAGPDRPAPARGRRLAGLVAGAALLCAALVLPPLGQRVLAPSDEARFLLLARDMMEDGDWLAAEVRGRLYRNKPPLYPWAIAAASRPAGRVTEASGQLPVALAAVVVAAATAALGGRLFGPRAGLAAGLVTVSTVSFFTHSQILLPDMLMVAGTSLAALAFWLAVADGGPPRPAPLAGFHAALALALAAKGPAGLLPLLPAGAWLWRQRGPRALAALASPLGVALFAAITAVWLLPYLAGGAGSFAERVVLDNWLGWYWGLPSPRDKFQQLVDAVVQLMPWTPVLGLAIGRAVRERADPAVRYALLSLLLPAAAILIGENTRVRYLLPLVPAVALLVAWWLADLQPPAGRAARVLAAASGALGLALLAGLARPDRLLPKNPLGLAGPTLELLPVLLGVAVIAGCMVAGLWTARSALLLWGVGLATAATLAYGIWPYTWRFNRAWDFRGLAARVEREAAGAPVAVFGGRWFSLDYYLGRDARRLYSVPEFDAFMRQPGPRVVVASGRVWEALREQMAPGLAVVVRDRTTVGGQAMLILRRERG